MFGLLFIYLSDSLDLLENGKGFHIMNSNNVKPLTEGKKPFHYMNNNFNPNRDPNRDPNPNKHPLEPYQTPSKDQIKNKLIQLQNFKYILQEEGKAIGKKLGKENSSVEIRNMKAQLEENHLKRCEIQHSINRMILEITDHDDLREDEKKKYMTRKIEDEPTYLPKNNNEND